VQGRSARSIRAPAASASPSSFPPTPATKRRNGALLPALNGSLADNAKVVVTALGTGELSPDEAVTILSALATQARIVEVDEMEKRITALEKGTDGKS